jgi:hypothetical protein
MRIVRTVFLSLLVCLGGMAVAQLGAVATGSGSGDLSFATSTGISTPEVGLPRRSAPELSTALTLPRMSPELALHTFEKRSARQAAELGSYSATTLIRAELPESSQRGEFELQRHYVAPRTLEFKTVQFTGDSFVKNNIITRLLQSEVDHVQKDDPALTAISEENYKFSYKSTPMIQGRLMHVYQAKPRKKRVGLFKGRIYLDAYTGSLVYATGTVVKSPSFFVKKIEFVQEYADFGPFTLAVHIHSEATARLVGRTVVDIYQRDYQPVALDAESAHEVAVAP